MATVGPLICNISKGRFVAYSALPLAADGLVWFLASGAETENNIKDATDMTALFATVLNEATFTGYTAGGQAVAGGDISINVVYASDWVLVDITTDPSWSPTSAEALTEIILAYDNDTGGGTYANIIPMFVDQFELTTPTSGSVTYQVATGGFGKAA